MKLTLPSLPLILLGIALILQPVKAQEISAKDLAASLSAGVLDGDSVVKLKMEMTPAGGGAKTSLQLQMKSRRTQAVSEVVYQVTFPKERKGESVLVRKTPGQAATGAVFVPPNAPSTLTSAQMQEGLFGSDLAYADLVENFFAWENQALVGTETVDRIPCQILESKPGRGDRSPYAVVRSWIDTKKLVPMRVEKFLASGQSARRLDTMRVEKDDTGRPVAASLMVRRAGHASITEISGSNIRHNVSFGDADFTPQGLQTLTVPRSK